MIVQQQNNSQRDTSPADPQGQETQHSFRNSSPIVAQRQSFRDNSPAVSQRHETQQSFRDNSPAVSQRHETQQSFRGNSPIAAQRQLSYRDSSTAVPQRHETQQSYRETKQYHQDSENQVNIKKLVSLDPLFYLEDTHFNGRRARKIPLLRPCANYQYQLSLN